jgi:CheY-like chemotaxis protein
MAHILVIDDQPHVRAVINSVLGAKGMTVVGVGNGAMGLKEFDTASFDLVIVDIYLPGMDGVKVIKELKARAPAIPVVAISGVLLRPSNSTALDIFPQVPSLADVVRLKKPFRAFELLAAVDKAMALSPTVH